MLATRTINRAHRVKLPGLIAITLYALISADYM